MMDMPVFRLERHMDASLPEVWAAWSNLDLLEQWYGHGAGIETVTHDFAFRVGGLWRHEMRLDARRDYSRVVFKVIDPMTRLSWVHHSTDAHWNTAPSPSLPCWPQEILTTVTLVPIGHRTRLALTMVPVCAGLSERMCFVKHMHVVEAGWQRNLSRMEQVLISEMV